MRSTSAACLLVQVIQLSLQAPGLLATLWGAQSSPDAPHQIGIPSKARSGQTPTATHSSRGIVTLTRTIELDVGLDCRRLQCLSGASVLNSGERSVLPARISFQGIGLAGHAVTTKEVDMHVDGRDIRLAESKQVKDGDAKKPAKVRTSHGQRQKTSRIRLNYSHKHLRPSHPPFKSYFATVTWQMALLSSQKRVAHDPIDTGLTEIISLTEVLCNAEIVVGKSEGCAALLLLLHAPKGRAQKESQIH